MKYKNNLLVFCIKMPKEECSRRKEWPKKGECPWELCREEYGMELNVSND